VASGGVCTAKVNVKPAVKQYALLPILVAAVVFFACFIAPPIAGATSKSSLLGVQGDDPNTEVQLNTQENLQIHTYHLILVGYPTVTRVTISLGQEVPNVDVLVEELEGKPAGAAEPFLPVRAYVSINVGEASVENAAIEFKVPKSWVEQNNIDEYTIKLLRLNSEWRELPTRLTRSSDLYFYFEAQTQGFSIFAVVGEAKGPVAGPPLALYAAILMIAVAGGFSAVYWFLTRPMKPFISLKRLKRMVSREKVERPEESELEIADVLRRLRKATKVKRAYRPPSEEFEQEAPKFKRRHVSNKKDVERLRRLRRKMMGEL
jgi:PGF-pre-PGF domain-containing protein